jgi:DNA-directed RNA polymerase subunit L
MNILIVESENDQYFVQALSNYLNNTDTTVCTIDDYKHSSLDKTKLKIQIGSALTTKKVLKVGARNRIKKSIQNDTFRGLRISTSKKNDTKMTQKRFLFEK